MVRKDVMTEFFSKPTVQLFVWLAVLAIMSVSAYYVLRRLRDGVEQAETSADMLAKFREMRDQGELSEADFRSIKTILGERMQAEIKRDRDTL